MENKFIHLNVHSDNSLLKGTIRLEELIQKTKKLKMDAVALTDDGVLYGVLKFYSQAVKEGIKPIVGCSLYLAPRKRFDKDEKQDRTKNQITLLVKDAVGYKNLMKMVSLSHIEGFYFKPRIDFDLIEKHHEGLVCLSGNIHDVEIIKKLYKIFGSDFYIELQGSVAPALDDIRNQLKIPVVATNNVHYLDKEDAFIQDAMCAIRNGQTFKDKPDLDFAAPDYYFKTSSEMTSIFKELPEAIKNTIEITKRCNFKFDFEANQLPIFKTPKNETAESYLQQQAYIGLQKRYNNITEEVKKRLDQELSVINKSQAAQYFLIIADIVNFAHKKKIQVGCGRGAVAGSLIAYSLGITDIDPIKYDLLFERFLNSSEKGLPDITIDYCIENRYKVLDYIKIKYGKDHVAKIVTFREMNFRLAIHDIGRVLGLSEKKLESIINITPDWAESLNYVLGAPSKLRDLYDNDPDVKKLFDLVDKVIGVHRHIGIHASGVVVTKEPILESIPVVYMDNQMISQHSRDDLIDAGFLTIVSLGLKALTNISKTIELIQKNHKQLLDINNIPIDDVKTFYAICNGKPEGIFQMDSSGMQELVKEVKPSCFDDIVAILAMYRPGPLMMKIDKEFVKRKNGITTFKYLLPELEPILKSTYGVILYQEQLMQIASKIANFSLSEANLLRKVLCVKNIDKINNQKRKFIEGAKSNNIPIQIINQIFDMLANSAEYLFMKAHAVPYSRITYQTAYLKTHYPAEFKAAIESLGNKE